MKIQYLFLSLALGLASCTTQRTFYRADIIGFGDEVRTSYSYSPGIFKNIENQSAPIDLLHDAPSVDKALSKVVPRGNNTSLYYAADLACDRIRWVKRKYAKNDRATRFYLFLLTDGLDNSSVHAAKRNRQATVGSAENYRARVQRKIKHATGLFKNTNDLTVYPMLRVGKDLRQIAIDNELTDEAFEEYLDRQFECFRYATRGEAPELIQEKDWKHIESMVADQLVNNALDFRVAKDFKNKRIRMTMLDANNHEGTVEGTLKRFFGQYRLVNVKQTGILKDSLNTVSTRRKGRTLIAQKTTKEQANVFFSITGLKNAETQKMYVVKDVRQSVYDGELWQANTEYNRKPYILPNAYCIFLIDGSLSLSDKDVQEEIQCVKRIINIINPKTLQVE